MVLAEELRESVLRSAIRGELSTSLSTDTPVEKTFYDIEKLDVDGIELYSIPKNWKYVAISDISDGIEAGKSPNCIKSTVNDEEWGVITTTAIQWGRFDSSQNKKLPDDFKIQGKWIIRDNDILITRAGPMARTGVACVVNKVNKKIILSDKTLRLQTKYINRDFFVICMRAFDVRKQIMNIMNGMDKQQVNISQKNILKVIVPFPPIEEQQRIVDRVNELMEQIDEYTKIEQQLISLKDSFPGDLRSAILQAAMQGKLTEQLDTDSSVDELMKNINEIRYNLIISKAYKKSKKLLPLSDDEIPFDIPASWRWVKLGYCSTYGQSKKKATKKDIESEKWALDLEDVEKVTGCVLKKIPANKRQINGDKICFRKGDILYSKLRPYLLKILIADEDGICTPELIPFSMIGQINPKYVLWVLRSPHVDYKINAATYGVKMPRVGVETMLNLLIPLPPVEEQQRIVKRLDTLLPLCNSLNE